MIALEKLNDADKHVDEARDALEELSGAIGDLIELSELTESMIDDKFASLDVQLEPVAEALTDIMSIVQADIGLIKDLLAVHAANFQALRTNLYEKHRRQR